MPTVLSHALVAFTGSRLLALDTRTTVAAMGCAMIADLDVFLPAFGVPWSSFFAHRGFTHTFGFAVLLGVAVALLFFRDLSRAQLAGVAVLLAAAAFSHPLLDMLTNGGHAIPLLWPLDDTRHFFPWRPIEVSPFIGGFFTPRGWEVVKSELVWIGLPCAALLVANALWRGSR